MPEPIKKFSEDLLKDFHAALLKYQTEEVISKIKAADAGTFKVIISTSDEDRQGDTLDQSKWNLENYKQNPVVLWAHDYDELPIGVCTSIYVEGEQLIAEGKFAPAELNPFAGQIAGLYEAGFIKTTSVGYIIHEDGEMELLEFSFVPVPANPFALSLREMKKLKLDVNQLATKGLSFLTKGAVPYKDHGTVEDTDTAWDGPAEVKACGDDVDKLKSICAWFDGENPDMKSSYKLPHHRASDLKAVWKGVAAAMGALLGARGGAKIDDKEAVYNHLKKHYAQFDKDAPDFEKAMELAKHLEVLKTTGDISLKFGEAGKDFEFELYVTKADEAGDRCEMPDGSIGILADDPEHPGTLVCIPNAADKSNDNNGDMNNELLDSMKAEHARHGGAVTKAVDEFKSIDEFKSMMDPENDMHLENSMKAIDEHYGKDKTAKGIDEFKSALHTEHGKHVVALHKAIDEYQKAIDDGDGDEAHDDFAGAIDDELERHAKAQMEICSMDMGEGEDDEEKGQKKGQVADEMQEDQLLQEKYKRLDRAYNVFSAFCAAYLEDETPVEDFEKLLDEAVQLMKNLETKATGTLGKHYQEKSGREISAKNKTKIKTIIKALEDHHAEHGNSTNSAIAALKDLLGPDEGNEGEEQKPPKTASAPKPKVEVRDIRQPADAFEAFMASRRVLRTVDAAVGKALEDLNRHFKDNFSDRR